MNSKEICPICEGKDERYADGLWDLTSTICAAAEGFDFNNQDIIYYILTAFIERKGYCPNCGKKINKQK